MTTDQQLKEITQDIREKLPRLKELTEGCVIFRKRSYQIVKSTTANEFNIISSITGKSYYSTKEEIEKGFKIIGHEPMLNDVLQWLSIYFNDSDLNFITMSGGIGKGYYDMIGYEEKFYLEMLSDWNISRAYLKDQSPELINFLYNLKEKK